MGKDLEEKNVFLRIFTCLNKKCLLAAISPDRMVKLRKMKTVEYVACMK